MRKTSKRNYTSCKKSKTYCYITLHTRLILEILKELEQKDNYTPLCIRINGLNLYDDIKTSIKNDKKYIIFIDDINNLNGLNSIIDLIITNKNEEIKIVATVRDYLLDDILNKYFQKNND